MMPNLPRTRRSGSVVRTVTDHLKAGTASPGPQHDEQSADQTDRHHPAASALPLDLASRRFVSLRQAASYVGLSAERLRKLIAEGKGPKISRPGGRAILIRVSDLDAWMERPEAA
jgi:excisionase family DNA binding protein